MKPKVAAYITLYEDMEAAYTCIQALRAQSTQVDIVFIIDNSQKKLLEDSDKFLVIHHYPNNIGIGQGLRLAIEWSTVQGYDFLWTFDQDSIPTTNCLETLLKTYNKLSQLGYKVGIVAPTAIDPRTGEVVGCAVFKCDCFVAHQHKSHLDFYECDSPITSGSLISIAAAKTISPIIADFFMDGIDLQYGMQIKQHGFHNFIVPKAILHHNFGNPTQVKFLGGTKIFQNYSSLRHYYICRNHTYLETRYARGLYCMTSYLRRLKYLFRTIILISLYDYDKKGLKAWACLLGTYHGFKGKLGKIWQ